MNDSDDASLRRADRNLLFVVLALQMDVVSREQVVQAANAWVQEKSKSIDEILFEQRAIDADTRAALALLAQKRWPQAADLPIESELRRQLRALDDPDIDSSIIRLGSESDAEDPAATLPLSAGHGLDLPRYRKLRTHAKGGLGEVFLAQDDELDRRVALKEMQDKVGDNRLFRERFLFEAIVTGRLEHPGIVPVYGLGRHPDGRPFYAMRFIRGQSFQEAIAAFHESHDPHTEQLQRSLQFRGHLRRFVDVCNAIHYAHSKGVLHRDIKPANVMLGKHGETLVVDWGLAKRLGSEERRDIEREESIVFADQDKHVSRTEMGSVYGTPEYMSPEQALGRMDLLQPASDVYSLGVVLYVLLTGTVPFTSKNPDRMLRTKEILEKVIHDAPPAPRDIRPKTPLALQAVCLKALSKNADERQPTARALADDIERWLADEPISQIRATVDYFASEYAASPNVSQYAERLARELFVLSTVLAAMERHDEALEAANRALETLDNVPAANPRQRLCAPKRGSTSGNNK